LSVKDDGIGISEDQKQHLFKDFKQLDAGPGRHFEGTGLGLVLTRNLVELQGGSIGVESEPGIGSTFKIILPRTAAARSA
jgi:signal transduction histidine kinase